MSNFVQLITFFTQITSKKWNVVQKENPNRHIGPLNGILAHTLNKLKDLSQTHVGGPGPDAKWRDP